jgi:hypothetical protein
MNIIKENLGKFLGFLFLTTIVFLMVKKFGISEKAKPKILGPKEIQYFCLLSKNKTSYSMEVFGIDWRKGNLSLRSRNNEFPLFTQDILKDIPILQSPFTFLNNNINFKTIDDKDEWVTPLNMDPETLISPILDWHGNKYSQNECPWIESQFVENLKNQFLEKKISILCFHNPKNAANTVFVLNSAEKRIWTFATESLSSWRIFSPTSEMGGTYNIEKNSISLQLTPGKTTNFIISKKSQDQILELNSKEITLSQNACTWISKERELTEIKKNRANFFCLKPFPVGLKKTAAKSTPTIISAKDYSVDEYPNVSSVIQLNEAQKTFKFFGNFLGDIMELLEPTAIEGTIDESEGNLSFFSNEGKKIFTGSRVEKGFKIKDKIFKNEFCPF